MPTVRRRCLPATHMFTTCCVAIRCSLHIDPALVEEPTRAFDNLWRGLLVLAALVQLWMDLFPTNEIRPDARARRCRDGCVVG